MPHQQVLKILSIFSSIKFQLKKIFTWFMLITSNFVYKKKINFHIKTQMDQAAPDDKTTTQ